MHFEGTGDESDDVIEGYVEQVKSVVNLLVTRGRAIHEQRRAHGGEFPPGFDGDGTP
jgi:hypothetical protein